MSTSSPPRVLPSKPWKSYFVVVWLVCICLAAGNFAFKADRGLFQATTGSNQLQVMQQTFTRTTKVESVCVPWETDMDGWWQMHPDWEPDTELENRTHTCFRPIAQQSRAVFMRRIYRNQYHDRSCREIKTRNVIGTGYAAAMNWLGYGFWTALSGGFPFQPNKHKSAFRWMYAPPYANLAPENRSWAACPREDHTCYFLNISNCHVEDGAEAISVRANAIVQDLQDHPERREQYAWLYSYLARPHQHVRQRLAAMMREEAPQVDGGCTWIHVRRGDAMTEKHPRNFHRLAEYLEKGNVSVGETILLMTDDQLALEEAQLLHPQYHIRYWNRTRNRGEVKGNMHFPSNDQAGEFLVLLAELQLAGKCAKGVHGTSNMVEMFKHSMILQQHGLANIQMIRIDDIQHETRINPT